MAINISPAFEAAVAATAGLDPATIDPGSMQIDLINPDPTGNTTVRFTVVTNLPTAALRKLVAQQLAATLT